MFKATGAVIQSTVNGLDSEVLGSCGLFEERQVGRERYNFFTGLIFFFFFFFVVVVVVVVVVVF